MTSAEDIRRLYHTREWERAQAAQERAKLRNWVIGLPCYGNRAARYPAVGQRGIAEGIVTPYYHRGRKLAPARGILLAVVVGAVLWGVATVMALRMWEAFK